MSYKGISTGFINEYVEEHIPIPTELLLNLVYSVVLFASIMVIRRIIIRAILKRVEAANIKAFVEELAPALLRLVGTGILLNLWLTGDSSLASLFNISNETASNILNTTYIFIFYLAAKRISTSTIAFLDFDSAQKQYSATKYSYITIGVISFLLLIKIWVGGDTNLSTYFGLLSAGIAIALQDAIASIAGWLYLISIKPFSIGERIKIGNNTGDVADIRTFYFSLQELAKTENAQQPTGRIIHIPNREIFSQPIANFNAGFNFVWHEIPILVTFESNWKKTEKILQDILEHQVGLRNQQAERQIKKAARTLRMHFGHLNSKLWVSVADSGVLLTMRFLVDPRKQRSTSSKIWVEVLEKFAECDDIDFAYPTQRFYHNQYEGKPQAKASIPNLASFPPNS